MVPSASSFKYIAKKPVSGPVLRMVMVFRKPGLRKSSGTIPASSTVALPAMLYRLNAVPSASVIPGLSSLLTATVS